MAEVPFILFFSETPQKLLLTPKKSLMLNLLINKTISKLTLIVFEDFIVFCPHTGHFLLLAVRNKHV